MAELARFKEKVREYRLLVSRTQAHLANYLDLDYTELSNRLNATKKARLSHDNVRAIVRALADWGAITTQAQARELLDLVECPYFDEVDWQAPPLSRLKADPFSTNNRKVTGGGEVVQKQKEQQEEERQLRLRAISSNPNPSMQSRLSGFVGREQERSAVRDLITRLLPTGGYLTVTGPAGQGKSSLIARLVEDYRQKQGDKNYDRVIHHFIPLNPGPDHQVSLLRDLLAQLILKYGLPEFYLNSESRPALRDYFLKVLHQVSANGQPPGEIIFIDGLDQLEDELTGSRDLSFLPMRTPQGVVFVLGTRPNDTLKPLQLLKPHYEYRLPDFSRADFDLLLGRYNLAPARLEVDRFYETMQHNALYLSLVVQELASQSSSSELIAPGASEIIESVATNPDRLFSLAFERLKRFRESWREVIRPVLGVLMVAQEPLGLSSLRQLLEAEEDLVRDGLSRLGGLLAYDEKGRVQLYHLKLKDYLKQDPAHPEKEYLFALSEEEEWHAKLARWCVPVIERLLSSNPTSGINSDQSREEYAVQHYVRHLFGAGQWTKLWEVLDQARYGQLKLARVTTIGSYAQDLELGREAAARSDVNYEEGIALLPRLWRYSFLRSTLANWANYYSSKSASSDSAFKVASVEQLQANLALAELLTIPEEKAKWLLTLALHLQEEVKSTGLIPVAELEKVVLKAYDGVSKVEAEEERALLLNQLLALSDLRSPVLAARAEELALSFNSISERIWALEELAKGLQRQGQLELAVQLHSNANQLVAQLETSGQFSEFEAVSRQGPGNQNKTNSTKKPTNPKSSGSSRERQNLGVESATTIYYEEEEGEARYFLSQGLARSGELVRASEVASSIKDLEQTVKSLTVLAKLAIRLNPANDLENRKIVLALLEQARDLILNLPPQLVSKKDYLLKELIEALTLAGHPQRAVELVDLIQKPQERVSALANLAAYLDQTVDKEFSETGHQLWRKAETVAMTIPNRTLRAFVLKELAGIVVLSEDQQEEAYRLVSQIELIYLKIAGLAELVAKQPQFLHSIKWTREALELLPLLESTRERTVAFRALVGALAKTGEIEQAQNLALQIPHSGERDLALHNLITELASNHQWHLARQVVASIENIGRKVVALSLLCTSLAEAEEIEEARRVLTEARAMEARLTPGAEKLEARLALTRSLLKLEEWEYVQELVLSLPATPGAKRAQVMVELIGGLIKAGRKQQALKLLQQQWRTVSTTRQLFQHLVLVQGLFEGKPNTELLWDLYQTFKWVADFMTGIASAEIKN